MEKASRALLKVAAIFGTVCGALILACVPVMLVLGISPTIREMLTTAIEDGSIHTDLDLPAAQIALGVQIVLIVTAVMLIFVGGCCVANAIISSKTREEPTRGRYIACIITGALSTDFSIIGSVFGLIVLKRKERRQKLEQ